jgi:hypothetical protein
MGMSLLTLSDDLTIQHVECGKQGRSAITFVVVGHRFCVVNSTRRATSTFTSQGSTPFIPSTWSYFILINLKFHQECNTTPGKAMRLLSELVFAHGPTHDQHA